MASKVYTRQYVDGTEQTFQRDNQGRKPLPKEIKKVYKMTMVTPQAKKIIEEKAKQMNMSYSAYVELAGVLFSI